MSFSNIDSYKQNITEKGITLFNSFLLIIEKKNFEEFENKS